MLTKYFYLWTCNAHKRRENTSSSENAPTLAVDAELVLLVEPRFRRIERLEGVEMVKDPLLVLVNWSRRVRGATTSYAGESLCTYGSLDAPLLQAEEKQKKVSDSGASDSRTSQ